MFTGLLSAGVCGLLTREEVFDTGDGLLLNGLFGVSKEEYAGSFEILRLIMNLVPFNAIAEPMAGDVATLPTWSMMSPLFLQPTEQLLISSEDVRCFFYVMSVPDDWMKFLAFNKVVPDDCLPAHLKGRETYLAAKVLPMGFLNSVSLAQHAHRNLVLGTNREEHSPNPPVAELRKDKLFTSANPAWRVYLDNYDLLERVSALEASSLVGSTAPPVLALRNQYEVWEVPRNLKKAVERAARAEVQGAQVDGEQGTAVPRESKLLKYITAALDLLHRPAVSQRQMQVVCGGLVYVSMFRRPLLGSLNKVWTFIESFTTGSERRVMPRECRIELLRFLGLVPLARMDFRLSVDGQVTCSDASTTGGGMCASDGITSRGSLVAQGSLRGMRRERHPDQQVLSIGLFDGIGAWRVALDLLGVSVIGHISAEQNPDRAVEAAFPGTEVVEDVAQVTEDLVRAWSLRYSQVSLILLGGGPPCQDSPG